MRTNLCVAKAKAALGEVDFIDKLMKLMARTVEHVVVEAQKLVMALVRMSPSPYPKIVIFVTL